MKQGETVPVTIAGQVVAQAVVKELGEGQVTLMVPATLVVMAVRTEIAPEAVAPVEEPTTETIITGVDRVSNDGTVESVVNTETQAGVPQGTPTVQTQPVTDPGETTSEAPAPVVEIQAAENVNPTVAETPADNAEQG